MSETKNKKRKTIMVGGKKIEDRREHCDDCVRHDFGTIKKLVFFILAVVVASGGVTSWVTLAKADKDHVQDIDIITIKKDVEVITDNIEKLTEMQIEQEKKRREDADSRREEQRLLIETLRGLKDD